MKKLTPPTPGDYRFWYHQTIKKWRGAKFYPNGGAQRTNAIFAKTKKELIAKLEEGE